MLTHESSDAVFAVAGSGMAQGMHDAWAAISAAAGGESCADLVGQHSVLAATLTLAFELVGVVAGGADGQGVAGFTNVHGGAVQAQLVD